MVPSASLRRSLPRALVPSYSALCRPAFIPALRLSQRFLLWVFGTVLGFACIRCAGSKPFWPLALVSQALPAIILAALRRFRGAALFHGPPPSPRLGASFWPSGLTLRSSAPCRCVPVTANVSPAKSPALVSACLSKKHFPSRAPVGAEIAISPSFDWVCGLFRL